VKSRETSTRRRALVALAAAFVIAVALLLRAFPAEADVQPVGKVPRVGYLSIAPGPSPRTDALIEGLRDLGYVEGKSVNLEYRWGQGNMDRLRVLAAELVARKVDIIVTGGPTATRAASEATRSIPIVMAFDSDPVEEGFVLSLSRPGRNVTGLATLNYELGGKRLNLLQEVIPALSRVAVLRNATSPGAAFASKAMEDAAHRLGVQLQFLDIRGPADFEPAFRAAGAQHADAIVTLATPVSLFNQVPIVNLAARYRLPAIYWERGFVEAGGLMSYAPSDLELHKRAAVFVDKILKGANPSELPVEQAIKYELVINLKTAKALGITIPQSLLLRAEEVIQ
jgi:putative ABC transport system substrate-binding protein